jgi:transcriptional regulator with XRE-family HTH domain
MKEDEILRKMLKILRMSKEKKIKEVEEDLGLGENVYGNYERGTRLPDVHTIKRIAQYYDVSVDFLMGVTDSPEINIVPKEDYTMDLNEAGATFLELIKNKKLRDLSKEELKEYIRITKILRERKKKKYT